MSDDLRERVMQAMSDELNGWMRNFAYSLHHFSKALIEDRIAEQLIADFPVGKYQRAAALSLTRAAGLTWCEDAPDPADQWRMDLDTEAVDIGVSALRAIPEGDAGHVYGPESGTWMFYEESLPDAGVDLAQIREYWQGLTLRQAAQLVVDSENSTGRGR